MFVCLILDRFKLTRLSLDQQYLPLLSIPSLEPVAAQAQDGPSGESQHLFEADLLPDATKVTMLLEAAPDIRAAERDLREIDLLRARGVEGSGILEGTSRLRLD